MLGTTGKNPPNKKRRMTRAIPTKSRIPSKIPRWQSTIPTTQNNTLLLNTKENYEETLKQLLQQGYTVTETGTITKKTYLGQDSYNTYYGYETANITEQGQVTNYNSQIIKDSKNYQTKTVYMSGGRQRTYYKSDDTGGKWEVLKGSPTRTGISTTQAESLLLSSQTQALMQDPNITLTAPKDININYIEDYKTDGTPIIKQINTNQLTDQQYTDILRTGIINITQETEQTTPTYTKKDAEIQVMQYEQYLKDKEKGYGKSYNQWITETNEQIKNKQEEITTKFGEEGFWKNVAKLTGQILYSPIKGVIKAMYAKNIIALEKDGEYKSPYKDSKIPGLKYLAKIDEKIYNHLKTDKTLIGDQDFRNAMEVTGVMLASGAISKIKLLKYLPNVAITALTTKSAIDTIKEPTAENTAITASYLVPLMTYGLYKGVTGIATRAKYWLKQNYPLRVDKIKAMELASKIKPTDYSNIKIQTPKDPIKKTIWDESIKRGGTLGGSRSIEAHGIKLTRYKNKGIQQSDLDFLWKTNQREITNKNAKEITKILNKKFGKNRFRAESMTEQTINARITDTKTGNHYDFVAETNPTRKIDGINVLKIEKQISKKAEALRNPERAYRTYDPKGQTVRKDFTDFVDIVQQRVNKKIKGEWFLKNSAKQKYTTYNMYYKLPSKYLTEAIKYLPYYSKEGTKYLPKEKYKTPYEKYYKEKYPYQTTYGGYYQKPEPYKGKYPYKEYYKPYYPYYPYKPGEETKYFIKYKPKPEEKKKKITKTKKQEKKKLIKAHIPIYYTETGTQVKGQPYGSHKEAVETAMMKTDQSPFNKFIIEGEKVKPEDVNKGFKYSKYYKFNRIRGTYHEKRPYRFDTPNERSMDLFKFLKIGRN